MWTRSNLGQVIFGGVELRKLFQQSSLGTEPLHTPAYVYDLDGIANAARGLKAGFGEERHLVAYAIKANSAAPIARTLLDAGCGIEVVSAGELALAQACGASPERILYSGVAKTNREIDEALAAGDRGIYSLQVESVEEIARVDARAAAMGRRARISFRINPGIEADTHAYVATGHDEAKFGIALEDLPSAWSALKTASRVDLVGLSCHIGSQLTDTDAYLAAADALLHIAAQRHATRPLLFIDFGGGFGIDYGSGCPIAPVDFARAVVQKMAASALAGCTIVVEPGRALVAPFGVLCAQVIMSKRSQTGRRWLMIDAGMNDLIRPALYAARHRIESLEAPASAVAKNWRVVGPVCESSDDFGEHAFDEPLPEMVAIRDAGAYGFTMASQYNGRALPLEVFLSGGRVVSVHRPASVEAWVAERLRVD